MMHKHDKPECNPNNICPNEIRHVDALRHMQSQNQMDNITKMRNINDMQPDMYGQSFNHDFSIMRK